MSGSASCVIVKCHDLVCAIDLRWVARLVLPEQISPLGIGLAQVENERYAAWDLGERLGMPPLRQAWVLLRVPHKDSQVSLALRTGPCLVVQPLPKVVTVPIHLFSARQGSISALFQVDAKHGDAVYGIELDVPRLWTEAELAQSAQLVKGGKG